LKENLKSASKMAISHNVDVVVAGGGMAGIAAAIAAARSGAETILIEKNGWLGGMGITGATGLHSFFNIFDAHPGSERMRVVAGIAQELVDKVQELGGGIGHARMERGGDFLSMITPVEPETFKFAAARTCLEAGVKLLLHSVVDEVRSKSGHIEGVVVWNKGGRSLVQAKQYIDCTGGLCNIDLARLEDDLERRGVIRHLAHAVKPGTSRPDLVRLRVNMKKLGEIVGQEVTRNLMSSSLRPRELTYCNCINYGPNDGLDVEALTAAEIDLRGRMFDIADFFRQHIAGCKDGYVAGPAPSVGQRRARAIHCDYELTREDCTEGRTFEDQIGCFSFIDNPVDLVRDAGAYGIPYRALLPTGVDNALIAGRMMTVDLPAHNSTRNTVCCLLCGQAAGAAAAMAAAKEISPREVDVQELRDQLKTDGVLLSPRPDPIGGE